MTLSRHLAAFALVSVGLFAGGCSSQINDTDETEDAPGGIEFESQAAIVGQKARVTASSGLNLRTAASTGSAILATMPTGSLVDVLASSGGWYKVSWSGKTGWCSGDFLRPESAAPAPGAGAVADAMSRAQSGVGFSYWWGGGCWNPGASAKGSCTGSCPSCSHSGTWGADCSGFVAKVWQVPSASALSACGHPYSTSNFYNEHRAWSDVPRSQARRGDAFVHHENGAGHIFVYDSGDAWGWMKSYEAKGCSYGIVYNSRTAGTNYKVIRRTGY